MRWWHTKGIRRMLSDELYKRSFLLVLKYYTDDHDYGWSYILVSCRKKTNIECLNVESTTSRSFAEGDKMYRVIWDYIVQHQDTCRYSVSLTSWQQHPQGRSASVNHWQKVRCISHSSNLNIAIQLCYSNEFECDGFYVHEVAEM